MHWKYISYGPNGGVTPIPLADGVEPDTLMEVVVKLVQPVESGNLVLLPVVYRPIGRGQFIRRHVRVTDEDKAGFRLKPPHQLYRRHPVPQVGMAVDLFVHTVMKIGIELSKMLI